MLSIRRKTHAAALTAVFSVVYVILGLFPVSVLIGTASFLTFREAISPLAGMLFGPVVGAFSMILGNFVAFVAGRPVVFDFFDFIPDMVSAIVAGLAFTGRRVAAMALPMVLLVWFTLDPLSVVWVNVGGVWILFLWMHIVSVVVLAFALICEARGRLRKLAPLFIGAVTFASTMSGHVAGGIMYENVIFRLDGVVPQVGYEGFWTLTFYAYPLERTFFTVLGTMIAYPVLRSVSRRVGREKR